MRQKREELRTEIWGVSHELIATGKATMPAGAVHELEPFHIELASIRPIHGGLRAWGWPGRLLGLFDIGPVISWRVWVREAGTQIWADAPGYSHEAAAAEAIARLIERL